MLMELYVTDLEDIAAQSQSSAATPKPVIVESLHPYADESFTSGRVRIPGTRAVSCAVRKIQLTMLITWYQSTATALG